MNLHRNLLSTNATVNALFNMLIGISGKSGKKCSAVVIIDSIYSIYSIMIYIF